MTVTRTPRPAVVARDRGGGRRDRVLRPEECLFAVFLALLGGLAVVTGTVSWPVAGVAAVVIAGLAAGFALSRRRPPPPARPYGRHALAGRRALDGRAPGRPGPAGIAGGVVRTTLPFAACLVIYTSLREITPRLDLPLADPALIAFDRAVFGGDVSRWLNDTVGSPVLTFVMVACYLSYGVSQAVYALALHLRGRVREYRDFALAVSVVAVLGYTGYVLVPGVGPHLHQADRYADPLPGQTGPLGAAVDAITAVQGQARDLFPSLHTAMTVVLIVCLWRDARRWFWWYLPLGLGLLLSTVYLRRHYLVDVLAGIAIAALAVAVAGPVNRRWYGERDPAPAGRRGGPPRPT